MDLAPEEMTPSSSCYCPCFSFHFKCNAHVPQSSQQATCYPSFMDKLPSGAIAVESRVHVEGQVVTSRGPGTTMEYSLALVAQLYGKDKADEVAGSLVKQLLLTLVLNLTSLSYGSGWLYAFN